MIYKTLLLTIILLIIDGASLFSLTGIKTFRINIADPPSIRFSKVNEHFKYALREFINKLLDEVSIYPNVIQKAKDLNLLDSDIIAEIQAVAETLAPIEAAHTSKELTPDLIAAIQDIVIAVNMLYEFYGLCTSMCIRTDPNRIIHGRNFELMLHDYLPLITYQAQFYEIDSISKGEVVRFEAVMFAGVSNILTAVVPHQFSISINSSWKDADNKADKFINIDKSVQGLVASSMLIRKIAKEAASYTDALDMVKDTRIVASAFITICGTKDDEGVVIYKQGLSHIVSKTQLSDKSPISEFDDTKNRSHQPLIVNDPLLDQFDQINHLDVATTHNQVDAGILSTTLSANNQHLKTSSLPLILENSDDLGNTHQEIDYNVLFQLDDKTNYVIIGNYHPKMDKDEDKVVQAKIMLNIILPPNRIFSGFTALHTFIVLEMDDIMTEMFVYGAVMSAGGFKANESPDTNEVATALKLEVDSDRTIYLASGVKKCFEVDKVDEVEALVSKIVV